MAKLTSISLSTGVTGNDIIHIVNTSDISQSIDGSSYKATLNQLSSLFDGTYVTGSTFNSSTNILTLTRNDNVSLTTNLASLANDVYVVSGSYNVNTGVVTYTNSTGGTFSVSGFVTGFTDTYVTGGTYTSGTATFKNSTGGTFNVTGFTTPFTGGSSNCITDLYVTNVFGCSPITMHDDTIISGSTSKKLGINTSPTETLDVDGTSRLRGIVTLGDFSNNTVGVEVGKGRVANGHAYLDLIGDTTYTDYGLRIIRNSGLTSNSNSIISHRGTGILSIGAQDAGSLQFVTTDTARMFITSTGGTGIGTITPTELLDVAKPITGISARFRGSVDVGDLSGNDAQIRIGQSRTINGNSFLDLIGDTTNPFYGLRLIRWSATTGNALSQLTHKGTGTLEIVTEGAAPLVLVLLHLLKN